MIAMSVAVIHAIIPTVANCGNIVRMNVNSRMNSRYSAMSRRRST